MAAIIGTVLLTILKIILIILLVILAVVILVLVLPINYEAYASGDSREGVDSVDAKAKVCALLGIAKVKVCFKEGTLAYAVKVFGKAFVSGRQEIIKKTAEEAVPEDLTVKSGPEEKEGAAAETAEAVTAEEKSESLERPEQVKAAAEVKTEPPAPQEPEAPAEENTAAAAKTEESASYTEEAPAPEAPSKREMAKRRKQEEKEQKKLKKAEEAPAEKKSPGEKIAPLVEKAKKVSDIMHDPATYRTARRVKKAVFGILGHILPRRLKVRGTFGTGDPALTGRILGGIYMFYPWYHDKGEFALSGDFEETLVHGKLYFDGRIHPGVPVCKAAFLLRDRNIRKLIFGRKKKKADAA